MVSVCRTLSRRAHEYHTTMHGALRAYQSSFSLLESHGSMSRGEMLEGVGGEGFQPSHFCEVGMERETRWAGDSFHCCVIVLIWVKNCTPALPAIPKPRRKLVVLGRNCFR